MLHLIAIILGIGLWLLPMFGHTQPRIQGAEIGLPPEYIGPGYPIAGKSFREGVEIYKRHIHRLMQLPGVTGVYTNPKGLVVITQNPDVLPDQVEGLPILPFASLDEVPPLDQASIDALFNRPAPDPAEASQPSPPSPWLRRDLPDVAGRPYEEVKQIVRQHEAQLKAIPGVNGVTVGKEGIDIQIYDPEARKALPTTIEGLPVHVDVLHILPPPAGKILLRPGGVREEVAECPEGFREAKRFNWRFCVDKENPEIIPPIMTPPINGIPYEEALAILERHQAELAALPGVSGVGMGDGGIKVWTTQPELIPPSLEGLPVEALSPMGSPHGALHTTALPKIRPVHGGIGVRDRDGYSGTLTGVVLSQNKPWLVFPTHFLSACQTASPCPIASTSTLNACPHTSVSGTQLLDQPPLMPSNTETIGLVQRWDPLVSQGLSTDLAAAFLDNDSLDGNMSLHCDRKVENNTPITFSGAEEAPMMNENLRVYSANGAHDFPVKVTNINYLASDATFNCSGSAPIDLPAQMRLQVTSSITFLLGDSGSPVLDLNGNFVGMINWIQVAQVGQTFANIGGGNTAGTIKNTLKFDKWYGVNTSGFPLKCN